MSIRKRSLIALGFAAFAVGSGGCSPERTKSPGSLMLVTSTDLQVPKDISSVGIQVLDGNGVERHAKWYTLGSRPDRTELPATLAIEPGSSDSPIQVRIFAQRTDGEVVALSEAVTTVPRDRVAMLRMPIEWLSVGMVKPSQSSSSAPDAGVQFPSETKFASTVTTCPKGQTPHAGLCETSTVDSSSLPNYTPGQVYGDGSGNGDGACFDTVKCFANATPVVVSDTQNCVVNRDGAGYLAQTLGIQPAEATSRISLGMVPADGSGICGPGGCVVTLDYSPNAPNLGWSILSDYSIKLPGAVCAKLGDGSLRAVIATANCSTKSAELPTCGPWSSVHSTDVGQPTKSDLLSECWKFAATACQGIERCRGGTGFMVGATEDDGKCTERLRFLCDASLTRPEAAPWRKYFDNCGAAFAEPSCQQMEIKVRSACVEPSEATKADNTECIFGECGANSTCMGAVPRGRGVCQPRLPANSPHCGTNSDIDALLPQGACQTGLICNIESRTCQVPAKLHGSCSGNTTCDVNLNCVKGTCVAPLDAGTACSDDTECGAGLHCIGSNNRQLCRGPGLPGESCKVVAVNQQQVLWQQNLCDITQGLRCDPDTSTCGLARLVAQKEKCTTLNSCAGGYCSGILSNEPTDRGVCEPYVPDGSSCKSTAECGPPAECIQSVCRLRPVFGCSVATMESVPGALPTCTDSRLTLCNAGCVDLKVDSNNCGQCEFTCPAGSQCNEGVCACAQQQLRCNGVCTPVQTDPNNCGACNKICPSGTTCTSGQCTGCPSNRTACESGCVDTTSDSAHCGDCLTSCAAGQTCVSGKCKSSSTGAGGAGAGGASNTGGTSTGGTSTGGTTGTATGGTGNVGSCNAGSLNCPCNTSGLCLDGLICSTANICRAANPIATGGASGSGGNSGLGGTLASGGSTAGTITSSCAYLTPPTAPGQMVITAGNYVTLGSLQGYAFTWPSDSCVNPACDQTGCSSPFSSTAICAAGIVAADPTFASTMGIGFSLNQPFEVATTNTVASPDTIAVSYTNPGGSPLRAQVWQESSNTYYCVDSSQFHSGEPIPISKFNTKCWDNSGTSLTAGTPISSIGLYVPSSDTQSRSWSACMTGVAFGNGGTGGTSSTGGTSAILISTGGASAGAGGSTTTSGGASSIGGTSSTLGGTTSAGGASASGGTTAADAGYQPCPSVTTSGDAGGASSVPPLVITGTPPEAYVTSGDGLWYGYLLMQVDQAGSTIDPPVASLTSDLQPAYCTAGLVMPGNLATNPTYAGFGFYLRQNSDTHEVFAMTPASAGVTVDIRNNAESPLFVQLAGTTSANEPVTWCAPVVGNGGYIPWTSFNTRCWDNSGSSYRYEQLQSLSIVAGPGSTTATTEFDYCLVNVAESGSRSNELLNGTGWIGGDKYLFSDDPMGIQGSIFLVGDDIAYSPPAGNPCTSAGCCMQGSTVVDSTNAAWGASINVELGYYPGTQADNTESVCPYRGAASCFDLVLAGDTGGNTLRFSARATRHWVDRPAYPSVEVPAFSNGWSGRVCFSDLKCLYQPGNCEITGQWYQFMAFVLGGQRNSNFGVCLSSLRAVQNN